jgi:DNA-binding transcriptional ArsR family regulator
MLDLVLQAIAQQHRREILLLLQGTERSSGDIATHFALTRPAISQHLQVLVAAGLVTVRSKGAQRLYRAHPEGFAELRSFLEGFWEERLQLLKQEAEAEERRSRANDRT